MKTIAISRLLKLGFTSLLMLFTWLGAPALQGQPMEESWVQRYSHPTLNAGYSEEVIVDHSGNVVVAGVTGGYWIIIKYSATGTALWTNDYRAPIGEFEAYPPVSGIAVDAADNIFVTGSSYGPNGGDYLTVAFSSAGAPLWTNRYDGPANGTDVPTAIVVDSDGQVYVAGKSPSVHPNGQQMADFATICYSASGVPLWTNRYRTAAESYQLTAAVLNQQGDLIVTGGATYDRGLTFAYSKTGQILWTNRSPFTATAARADLTGNVFLTARFATVAYSSSGLPLWTNQYLGPGDSTVTALAVTTNGNVIVSGERSGGFLTVAYSNSGAALWTNRYASGQPNFFRTMTADRSGNLYLVGTTWKSAPIVDGTMMVAYSNTGNALWTNRLDLANPVGLTASDSVVLAGGSFTTLAFSSGGTPLWTNQYLNYEANAPDEAAAVAVGADGTIFVTGSSSPSDYATVAYSSAGAALWTNRYSSSSESYDFADHATAIAVSSNGTVFVTGNSDADYATIAYTSSGQALWTNRHGYMPNGVARAKAIAVDVAGNCFVTGLLWTGDSTEFVTVGYSALGAGLWTNRYDGPGNAEDIAEAIAVDRFGNVFVTGTSDGGSSSDDYVTLAYSNTGQPLWTNRYGAPVPTYSRDAATAIAVNANGNVVVTGHSDVGYAGTTIAYSPAGTALWTNKCGIRLTEMAADTNGTVFVAGNFNSGWGTVAYSNSGTALWTNVFGSGWPVAIGVDAAGRVIVTGLDGSEGGPATATVVYSNTGVPLGTNRIDRIAREIRSIGYAWEEFTPAGLAIDANGNVIIATTGSLPGRSDYVTIKYSPSRPTLAYQLLNHQLVLSWSHPGFALQAAPLATGGYTNIPGATSPFTNLLTQPQQFFRLKSD